MKTVKLVLKRSGAIYSTITMEQYQQNGKVKITCRNLPITGKGRATQDTIWVDKDDANKFYTKRIKDGYERIQIQ